MSSLSFAVFLHSVFLCLPCSSAAHVERAPAFDTGSGDLPGGHIASATFPYFTNLAARPAAITGSESDAASEHSSPSSVAAYEDLITMTEHNVVVAEVSPVSDGLDIGNTTLRPGDSGMITDGVICSAASSHRLIIVSSSYTSRPTTSSTNADQVLSSVEQTISASSAAVTTDADSSTHRASTPPTTIRPSQSRRRGTPSGRGSIVHSFTLSTTGKSGLPEVVTANPTSAAAVKGQFVLTRGSMAVTALQQASGVVQLGDRTLVPGGTALTSDGHTFTVVSAGIIEDGTMMLFSTTSLSSTGTAPVSTLGSSTLTAAPDSGSGQISLAATVPTASEAAFASAGRSLNAAPSSVSQDGSLLTFKTSISSEAGQGWTSDNNSLPSITHAVTPSRGVWGNGIPTPSTTSRADHSYPEKAMSALAAMALILILM